MKDERPALGMSQAGQGQAVPAPIQYEATPVSALPWPDVNPELATGGRYRCDIPSSVMKRLSTQVKGSSRRATETRFASQKLGFPGNGPLVDAALLLRPGLPATYRPNLGIRLSPRKAEARRPGQAAGNVAREGVSLERSRLNIG